jgi:pimeloyl-ACP methyl ester carboxylesterase
MGFAVKTFAPPAWREAAVQAAGVRIASFSWGSSAAAAPCVVLLHGLGHWSEAAWGELVPRLDPSVRYLAFDWPGFGASERPAARYDVAYFRDILDAVVDAAGIERFALVGHSLGGCVAAAYAADHAERVRALALIAPAGFGRTPRHLAFGITALLTRPLLARLWPRPLVRPAFRRAVLEPERLDPAMLARAGELFDDRKLRDAYARVYAGVPANFVGRARLHARWSQYRGPVFCAWGRHDRYIAVRAMRDVVRVYPDASSLILERSGHLPMVEEPAELAAALRAFLSAAPA